MTETDELIETFAEEEASKPKIDQTESIDDETVKRQLGEMGWIWKTVSETLEEASICFECKKEVNPKVEKASVLQINNAPKGTVAFCLVCEACLEKVKPKTDITDKTTQEV